MVLGMALIVGLDFSLSGMIGSVYHGSCGMDSEYGNGRKEMLVGIINQKKDEKKDEKVLVDISRLLEYHKTWQDKGI